MKRPRICVTPRRAFIKCVGRSAVIAALAGNSRSGLNISCNAQTDEQDSLNLACDLNTKIDPRDSPWTRFGWQKHGIVQKNGSEKSLTLAAELYFIGGEWSYNNSQMPYLVFMPERNRLMLAASVDKPPVKAIQVFSDDFGETWTKPTWMHTDAAGQPDLQMATQLSYLGHGKLICGTETEFWTSPDYGQTWGSYVAVPNGRDGRSMYQWDPVLVDRDADTNKTIRLVETRYKGIGTFDTAEYYSQGCVRFSSDEGRTWSPEIDVPQWKGVNEIVLCRAKNGDLVAACRTDNPKRFLGLQNDQYSGLATSISQDDGHTWSELNHVYEWGRHHPHLVLLPNGNIVMTYVVRNGYAADRTGRNRFGIEAVISRDHGKTWDLDHSYILASNSSPMQGDRANWGSPQSTSSVLLPDGSLITVFGTGVRNVPTQTLWKMDVALVKWRPDAVPTNSDTTLRDAPYDSDLRNRFDLDSLQTPNR